MHISRFAPERRLQGVTTTIDTENLLRSMFAAERDYLAAGGPGRATFGILAPFFSPDVVLHQARALPYGGVWRGHRGMDRFFGAMSRTWSEFEMIEQQYLCTTETAVVLTRVNARARSTGRDVSFPILQTLRVIDGRIAEVRPFYWDTAAIVAVLV
jgi:ketosteroid isomerase-like protein